MKSPTNQVLIIGPLNSGHINEWSKLYDDSWVIEVYTLHDEKFIRSDRIINITPSLIQNLPFALKFLFSIILLPFLSLARNPSFLHIHYISTYGILSIFTPPSLPKIFSIWGSDFNRLYSHKHGISLLKLILGKSSLVNAPSKDIESKLISIGINECRISRFQYGIDTDFIDTIPCPIRSEDLIVSIRNHENVYNIDLVIDSFIYYFNNFNCNAKLKIVGSFGNGDTLKLNLVDNVPSAYKNIEILGRLDKAELFMLMKQSKCCISIPSMDGMPLSVIEALYCGTTMVVSPIKAYDELTGLPLIKVHAMDKKYIAHALDQALSSVSANDDEIFQNTTDLILSSFSRTHARIRFSETLSQFCS